MENKINIAKILENCPLGMELDCTIWNNVVFGGTNSCSSYPIEIKIKSDKTAVTEHLTEFGEWDTNENSKCVIFPKGKTTWEGFVPPCQFKDGDVLFVDCSDGEDKEYRYIFILNYSGFCGKWHSYCHLDGFGYFYSKETYLTDEEYRPRLATEEEKQKLFQAIKDNGYKWNEETKTLEKIEPKFKVGDRIKKDKDVISGIVANIVDNSFYKVKYQGGGIMYLNFADQDKWKLVPNKFDITTLVPFESRVLVRHNRGNKWCGSFFSHIDGDFHSHCYKFVTTAGKSYPMCIPYEGNEYLIGKTDDCNDFYKTWK